MQTQIDFLGGDDGAGFDIEVQELRRLSEIRADEARCSVKKDELKKDVKEWEDKRKELRQAVGMVTSSSGQLQVACDQGLSEEHAKHLICRCLGCRSR